MATIDVSNAAQLTSALKAATGGDIIRLAAGDYGALSIYYRNFSSDVTITSKDPGNPAVFDTVSIKSSSNIVFDHVNVDFTPTMSTLAFTSAIMIDTSKGVSFLHSEIEGGPSINGVVATAPSLDSTGNVIGLPNGRGFTINKSSDITIEDSDISLFDRGIVLGDSDKVLIRNNEIHDLRRSHIVGNASNLTIEDNHLHDSNPWRWGETPVADHADYIAIWSDANRTTPYENLTIRGNVLEQGDGTAILGLWVAGKGGGIFKNVVIDDNAVVGGHHLGIMLTGVSGGSVSNNALFQTSGEAKGPGIHLRVGVSGMEVSDNLAWFVNDENAIGANHLDGNAYVQSTLPTKAGYYSPELIKVLEGLASADAMYAKLMEGYLKADLDPASLAANSGKFTLATTADLQLTGSTGLDFLTGGAGDDRLEGRGGADTLIGGNGDDTYVVPNSQVLVIETPGGGTDTVIVKGSQTLAANVENLTIENGNGWGGFGNALNNVIIGNTSGNGLDGREGNDTLRGEGGDDRLLGGDGADLLVGGAGNDTLTGGAGADKFQFKAGGGADRVLDFTYAQGDRIVLDSGQSYTAKQVGADVVVTISTGDTVTLAKVTLSALQANWIENGVASSPSAPTVDAPAPSTPAPPASGAGAGALIGDWTANHLIGGSGNDTLDGRGAADTLTGGAGDDTYIVPNSLAKIVELAGGGIDSVIAKGDHTLAANVENLTIDSGNGWGGFGNALNNVIIGNTGNNWLEGVAGNDTLRGDGGNDRLYGGDGADLLAGGAGNDTLTGGAGADNFQFKAGGGADRLLDFSYAQGDRVLLDSGQSYTAKQAGADVVLSLNTGDTLTLANVTLSSLQTGWIATA